MQHIKYYVLAGIMFVTGAWVYAGDIDNQIEEYDLKISDSQRSLEEISQKIIEMEKMEKEFASQKERIDNDLTQIGSDLGAVQDKIKTISSEIDSSKARKAVLQEKIKSNQLLKQYFQDQLSQNINEYYVDFLASPSPAAMDYVRLYYRKELMHSEAKIVESAHNEYRETQDTVGKVSKYQKQLKDKYTAVLENKKHLEQQKARQVKDKYILVSQKNNTVKELAGLQESALSLQSLINELHTKKDETERMKKESSAARKNMIGSKGNLPWPLTGSIISFFGKTKHPDLDTYIYNNGIKIKSNLSSEVHAIAPGKIVFSGSFGTFGKMVIIDHRGGFYTVYGHLNEILAEKNNTVAGYDIIGRVDEADKILYFEMRRNEDPQDPVVWLKKE
ncbi:MAG: peptidoglycan DD-metalloendopeptidase family protein [bacterium]